MIHGYHVILPCYGFWLPNDPRGSWSDFVFRWELARFGKATKSLERKTIDELSPQEIGARDQARRSLLYPPVVLTGKQALSVANGFREQTLKSGYTVWACAVLPEHTHLVIARHTYKVEQVAILMKGAATTQLLKDGQHPLSEYAKDKTRPPRMWAEHEWKVYLDTEKAIENAIRYVNENPTREGKQSQSWSWVTPFSGLDKAWVTYH